MRGTVLGSDEAGGMITTTEGQRYRFAQSQWRGARAPAAGDEVDFETRDGAAAEVYVVRPGEAAVNLGAMGAQARQLFEGGAASPGVARALSVIRSNLRAQLALAILLASVILHYVVVQGPGLFVAAGSPAGAYSVLGVGELVGRTQSALAAAAAGADQAAEVAGALGPALGLSAQDSAQERQVADQVKSQARGLHTASALMNLAYLLYLIPIGAVVVLVQAWRGRPAERIALGLGVLSALSFGGPILARATIAGLFKGADRAVGASVAADAIHFGLGSYVLLLAGLALSAVALGLVRRPA